MIIYWNSIFWITSSFLKIIQWLFISLKINLSSMSRINKTCPIQSHPCLFIPSIPISQLTDKLIYVSAKLNYLLVHNCDTFTCITQALQTLFFLSRFPSSILLIQTSSYYQLSITCFPSILNWDIKPPEGLSNYQCWG